MHREYAAAVCVVGGAYGDSFRSSLAGGPGARLKG